jgi:Leucine-rich repeat (LRR) protein
MLFAMFYTSALMAFVGILLGGVLLGQNHGLCPPCTCSTVAPTSLLLERCIIPTGYVALAAADVLEFNLTHRNITQVLPDAFLARGIHKSVRSVSLRGNHLTELPDRLFRDLLQVEHAEHEWDTETVDLSHNRLTVLPPRIFQAGSVRELPWIRELHLESNRLTTLPAGVFAGLTVKQLYLQRNNLTQLHPDSFKGFKLDYGILDMSGNKLQTLPPNVFFGLKVEQLYLQDNDLTTLPARVFQGFEVKQLHLQSNNLTQLHEDSFRGLKFPYSNINSILDISQNKLQTLPPTVFAGLEVAQLYLQNNKLQALPGVFTWGLASYNSMNLHVLNLAHNELSEVPQFDRFDNLRCLKLEGNRLQRLHQKTFRGSNLSPENYGGMPLEDLNLEQNQLTELHPDCFVYYSQLRENLLELKLGGNRLTALPDGLFNGRQGLSKLRILQLQSNRLARLPQKIFQTLGLSFSVLSDRNIQRIGAPAEPSP